MGHYSLRIAVPSLVDIKAEARRFFDIAKAKQSDNLERVVPIHRDLDVAEGLYLCEILCFLERLRVERRVG